MLEMTRMADKSGARQSLSDDEKAGAKALLTALEAFREIRHDMPLQYVVSFLLVCEEEGLGPNEYAKRIGVSPSVMSRHLLDIGDRNRNMEKGFELIYKRQDPMELRRFRCFLTDKGRVLARRIGRALGK